MYALTSKRGNEQLRLELDNDVDELVQLAMRIIIVSLPCIAADWRQGQIHAKRRVLVVETFLFEH